MGIGSVACLLGVRSGGGRALLTLECFFVLVCGSDDIIASD